MCFDPTFKPRERIPFAHNIMGNLAERTFFDRAEIVNRYALQAGFLNVMAGSIEEFQLIRKRQQTILG